MHLGIQKLQGNKNGKVKQDISNEEINEAILFTPKACSPDGIPIEFFNVLIPGKK